MGLEWRTAVELEHVGFHQRHHRAHGAAVTRQGGQTAEERGATALVVEDTGVLPCELERATSVRVRQALMRHELAAVDAMVGKQVLQYLTKHAIGAKMAGKEPWTDDDRSWRDVDLPYVEYTEG